jgi:glycosyltransferase involved in cell wall biosynthesis
MKNILIISYEFPPIIGGAGVYAHDLAIGLVKNGHQVSLLTYRTPANTKFLAEFSATYNIACHTIPGTPVIHFYQLYLRLVNLLKQQQFDLIIFSDARAKKMGALFSSSLQRIADRSVAVLHGGEQNSFFNQPSRLLKLSGIAGKMMRFLSQQQRIVVVSRSEYDLWENSPLREKLQLIRHGIDTEIFYKRLPAEISAIKAKLRIDPGKKIILSASRLVKQKGQELLIACMPDILLQSPDTLCIIAGDGNYLPALKEQVKVLGLEKKVLFTGGIPRTILSEYFAICDVFVLPSQFQESFGLVYLEAAACGKTAVAGNRGGTSEAVADKETGYLIDPFSRAALTDRIVTLLNDDKLRDKLSAAAYERALGSFSNTAMAARIVS